jgi:O-Antigen ligase
MARVAAMSARTIAAGDHPRAHASLAERMEGAGRLLAEVGLPFVLIVYLGLRRGGYDTVAFGEVGVAVWWVVLLGALIGVLPRARLSPVAWAAVGLLGAFTCWTALGISWSPSAEESTADLARVGTYLGVFALALCCQRPGTLRRAVSAVAAGITVIAALALMQRFHPSWFPANEAASRIPAAKSRLNYPLNYWNGLAALAAIAVPLLVVIAEKARTLPGRALAAGAVPALALTIFFTVSRGGVVELAVGLAVLLALYPRRLALLPILATTGLGSVILIAAASQRDALQAGLLGSVARGEANEMLAMTLVACAGVGLISVAIGVAARHGLGPRLAISPRVARRTAAGALIVAIVVAIAAGGPGFLSDRWHDFKDPQGAGTTSASRFESASGNGRYQWWGAALDANSTRPITGIGPGTFDYWWDQHGDLPGPVRDAHSLYLQTLAETGIVGLVLIVGLFGTVLFVGGRWSRRARSGRAYLAAATASCAVFAAAAAIDWVWQLAVLPAAFFLIAAAILAGRPGDEDSPAERPARLSLRLGLAGAGVAAIVAIGLPLLGAEASNRSGDALTARNLGSALSNADNARGFQPYAATPHLQQALAYELRGNYPAAVRAAKAATRAEATNWEPWVLLSRVEAEAGNAGASLAAYKQARSLNPRSAIFNP